MPAKENVTVNLAFAFLLSLRTAVHVALGGHQALKFNLRVEKFGLGQGSPS